MKALPAKVAATEVSLNTLRNCTSGAKSDPYAAEAIMHLRAAVEVEVTVVKLVMTKVCVKVPVVVTVVILELVDVEVHDITVMLVIVGEYVVEG